jgi:hypothetical protein
MGLAIATQGDSHGKRSDTDRIHVHLPSDPSWCPDHPVVRPLGCPAKEGTTGMNNSTSLRATEPRTCKS